MSASRGELTTLAGAVMALGSGTTTLLGEVTTHDVLRVDATSAFSDAIISAVAASSTIGAGAETRVGGNSIGGANVTGAIMLPSSSAHQHCRESARTHARPEGMMPGYPVKAASMSMPRLTLAAGALATLLAIGSGGAFAADAGTSRSAIGLQYSKIDLAVHARDVDAMVAPLAPDFVQTQPDDQTRSLAALRANAERLFHPQNQQVYPAQTTVIDTIDVAGPTATARGHQHVLVGLVDRAGNAVTAQGDSTFEDVWQRAGETWLLSRSHVLTQRRSSKVMPSRAMMSIIGQMHTTVEQLQQFNHNVNASSCYYSAANQNLGQQERMTKCEVPSGTPL